MTTLIERIQTDQKQARIEKNPIKRDLLTTLLGEIQNANLMTEAERLGKYKTTDENAIAELVVKSFLKNNQLAIDAFGGLEGGQVMILMAEKQMLEEYLPKQLSADELTAILKAQFAGKDLDVKSKGAMMGFLKTSYANQYDGKVAAQVVDNVIKG